jgi:hypothetical protein
LIPPLGVRFLVSEVAAFLTVIVVVRHAGNIRRLLAGTESRIGQKKAGENNAADAGSSGKPGA